MMAAVAFRDSAFFAEVRTPARVQNPRRSSSDFADPATGLQRSQL